MVIMRWNLNFCGVFIGSCMNLLFIQSIAHIEGFSIKSDGLNNQLHNNKFTGESIVSAHNVKPHMVETNEWRPLGHGDPLKNDPTFAYSPPTLDRVRYWAETNSSSDNEVKIQNRNLDHFPQMFGVANRHNNAGNLRKSPKPVPLQLGLSRHSFIGKADYKIKDDVPVLQPKYTEIRRNYYPHDLPMHLMPPPMHAISPKYQGDLKFSGVSAQQFKPNTSLITHKTLKYNPVQETPLNGINVPQKPFSLMPTARPFHTPRKPWLHELLQKEIVQHSKSPGSIIDEPKLQTTESFVPSSSSTTTTEATTTTTKSTTTTATIQSEIRASSEAPLLSQNQLKPVLTTMRPLAVPSEKSSVANKSEITVESHKILPKSPLAAGPMYYLIIEGHSKVKTYGQNEYDPSRPKIVPIIPKREPVAVMPKPNDSNLGAISKFPVKHLHTKTTTKPTTPVTPKIEGVVQIPKNITLNLNNSKAESITETLPKEESSGMHEILNFLDSMFATEDISTNGTTSK